MQQVDANTYEVSPAEVVTVAFSASGVNASLATFVVDNSAPPQSAGASYRFTVTKPVGQRHNGRFDCPFPAGTPAGAFYDVTVSGSVGGSFNGPHVISTGLTQQALRFRVV